MKETSVSGLTCLHQCINVKNEWRLSKVDPNVFARLLHAHRGVQFALDLLERRPCAH